MFKAKGKSRAKERDIKAPVNAIQGATHGKKRSFHNKEWVAVPLSRSRRAFQGRRGGVRVSGSRRGLKGNNLGGSRGVERLGK